jgi:hypothetical protein
MKTIPTVAISRLKKEKLTISKIGVGYFIIDSLGLKDVKEKIWVNVPAVYHFATLWICHSIFSAAYYICFASKEQGSNKRNFS